MLGLAEDRCRAVDLRSRLDQVRRIELVPAVVALITTGVRVSADRARALDVTVRQRMTGRRRECTQGLALEDIALLVQRAEEVLRDAVRIDGRRPREKVVRQPE